MLSVKNISRFTQGPGSLAKLDALLEARRAAAARDGMSTAAVILVDKYFEQNPEPLSAVHVQAADRFIYVETTDEPTTTGIDTLAADLRRHVTAPCAVAGIGGGIVLDTAKAVANLLTNPGPAAAYQGWDLVRNPAIFKIGVPTLSGTGAESSRTCVMTNPETGLKLGMNSDFTLYDELILDPKLTATVDRRQYFYSGMDTYIHCIESLNGRHRNPVGDALSSAALDLCRQVFLDGDMMSDANRERLMTASFLGGQAIAMGFVGVVHPLSAGLSVVFGTHHCVANCIVMNVMSGFYPEAVREFKQMARAQGVEAPTGIGRALSDDQCERLYAASIVHEKPLTNALGPGFRDILQPSTVIGLFREM